MCHYVHVYFEQSWYFTTHHLLKFMNHAGNVSVCVAREISCFVFGVSEHVRLLAIECQHPAPFILPNPRVPVATSNYTLTLQTSEICLEAFCLKAEEGKV